MAIGSGNLSNQSLAQNILNAPQLHFAFNNNALVNLGQQHPVVTHILAQPPLQVQPAQTTFNPFKKCKN